MPPPTPERARLSGSGAFKRAAHLSLQSVKDWIRPDGSGYIVKNRYPDRGETRL